MPAGTYTLGLHNIVGVAAAVVVVDNDDYCGNDLVECCCYFPRRCYHLHAEITRRTKKEGGVAAGIVATVVIGAFSAKKAQLRWKKLIIGFLKEKMFYSEFTEKEFQPHKKKGTRKMPTFFPRRGENK